jgi:hypothetical protein
VSGCEGLSSFASAYGSVIPGSNYDSRWDFDIDEDIDGSDFSNFIAANGL